MPKKPNPPDLAAILRAAITASGKSQLQLARESGVPQPKISRFLGGTTMQLENAGKLMHALGLEVREKK